MRVGDDVGHIFERVVTACMATDLLKGEGFAVDANVSEANATSDLLGAQAARHEPRRIAWTPEAKQISDRICVAGSRSTSIVPVTSGNRTHRDPIEGRGVPCGENR